jgi:hypothetical protein
MPSTQRYSSVLEEYITESTWASLQKRRFFADFCFPSNLQRGYSTPKVPRGLEQQKKWTALRGLGAGAPRKSLVSRGVGAATPTGVNLEQTRKVVYEF